MKRCSCGAMMLLIAPRAGIRACWYCDQGEPTLLDVDWQVNGVPFDGEVELGDDW